MDSNKIDKAIALHGARKVYEAAAARMLGRRDQLTACGLEAKSIGDANAIMTAAFAAMSHADRAADLTDIVIAEAKR